MISRRAFGIGALAMAGDGLVRPLNAPEGGPLAYGTQPGAISAVLRAALALIGGGTGITGVFVYDPSVGAGNLIFSATDAAADPFGNVTVKGGAAYVTFGGDKYAVGLNQVGPGGIPGVTVIDTASVPNVPAGLYAASSVTAALAEALLHSGKVTAGDIFASVAAESATSSGVTGGTVIITAGTTTVSGQVTATGGTAGVPTLITTDTWNAVTLDAGWSTASGYNALQYRLTPQGDVQISGGIGFTTTFTTSTAINSGHPLPAAYRPASKHVLSVGNGDLGSVARVELLNTGVMNAIGNSVAGTTWQFAEIDCTVSLL